MAYWLMKSEPFKYSWDRLVEDGRTHWDGVRNYQAANNLKAMKTGDLAFFYHSNEGVEIVGIARIVKEYYPDPSDASGRFGMVDIEPVKKMTKAVPLKDIKTDARLEDISLVRQSRLSVQSVSDAHWKILLEMGDTTL
ncbi:MAG: EVE domain-containing protein [Alphaproteobacteria bacterium]|nr:EVE domain-containing protein [Alphaproteobacteria bacterium]MBU0796260.1 EVE domain-containing protein [Alphaproteobacteria bacterium]MBU0887471.1 EVE domain-containing protein [Alphaproteobacteria bacterium]MBU1813320.1 EVE domain-containing protein [Alphaproteobacteria bacterium]